MREVRLILGMLVAAGCAARAPAPLGFGPRMPAFLHVYVCAEQSYSIDIDKNRVVSFSSLSDFRYAKITAEELSTLSALLANESLTRSLSKFESHAWPTFCNTEQFIIVSLGLTDYRIPQDATKGLSLEACEVLAIVDGLAQRRFAVSRSILATWRGDVTPNYCVNATVRPVTPLAVASVAPGRPARYALRWTGLNNCWAAALSRGRSRRNLLWPEPTH